MKRLLYLTIVLLMQMTVINAATFEAKLLDFHSRIYPDRYPQEDSYAMTVSVPRNYIMGLQLVVRSNNADVFTVSLKDVKNTMNVFYDGVFTLRPLRQITCEGNTQGSANNVPGGSYPVSWIPYFIRNAPFDLLEVVTEPSEKNILVTQSGVVAGALLQFSIPADCPIGRYSGKVIIAKSETDKIELPISFRVHKTVISRTNFLDAMHWLSAAPIDLCTNGSSVVWWGEEHWALLNRAGRLLYEDGNNMMYTPLVNGANPLIQAKYKNGKLSFDYSKFDRWIAMFDSIGYKYYAGYHLRNMATNLKIFDEASGAKKTLGNIGLNIACFQETFLKDFDIYLHKKGLHERFVLHLFDEPSGAKIDEYKHYNEMMRRCMPGIRSIDATNSSPQFYSDLVGFQVYNLPGIVNNKNTTVKSRLEKNEPVWLYNTTSPFPPYPNRHIDRELTENRLWPLLAVKYNCSGYLFWAVNTYRGVLDEYSTSLGALPDGRQMHAPGDAWFYYRTSNGLNSSMRLMSFREGMIDASLLRQLQRTNPDAVIAQLGKLILPAIEIGHTRPWGDYLERANEIPKGYITDYAAYHDNRKEVLELLDNLIP